MLASIQFVTVVLALHIIGVVIAFGAVFAAPIAVPAARRAGAGGAVAAAQLAVSRSVVRWGGLLVLVTGLYMASDMDVFSEWWVSLPLVVIIVVMGVNDAFLAPKYRLLIETPDDAAIIEQTDLAERAVAGLILLTVLVMVLGPYV